MPRGAFFPARRRLSLSPPRPRLPPPGPGNRKAGPDARTLGGLFGKPPHPVLVSIAAGQDTAFDLLPFGNRPLLGGPRELKPQRHATEVFGPQRWEAGPPGGSTSRQGGWPPLRRMHPGASAAPPAAKLPVGSEHSLGAELGPVGAALASGLQWQRRRPPSFAAPG